MWEDKRKRYFTFPTAVVLTRGDVSNSELLLKEVPLQTVLDHGEHLKCTLLSRGAGVLLDFGEELHGGLRIVTRWVRVNTPSLWTQSPDGKRPDTSNSARVTIRFGESVSEAMTPLGDKKNPTNDHAVRDEVHTLTDLCCYNTSETGYRYAYIELLDDGSLELCAVAAVRIERDVALVGSFRCDDELLNRIWQTAMRTVHLNMQDHLWDGIKRDRLVWVGDMHTEVMTILSCFGDSSIVDESLALMDKIDGDRYMNGFITYSMWWVLCREEMYMHTGNIETLRTYEGYLRRVLREFLSMPEANGKRGDTWLFLDWPTQSSPEKTSAGVVGILRMTFRAGARLLRALGDDGEADIYDRRADEMAAYVPDDLGCKGARAFLTLAGLTDPKKSARMLTEGGAHGFSTFLGYYLLEAIAMGGDTEGALDAIRSYWGGMLEMGATSFWEDFDLDWMENSSPITRLPREGERDIHGDFGNYCYRGFRHSLCHGWASGPCPFLSRHVLGIRVLESGMKRVRIEPHLGTLRFAEGSYPTPYGEINVRHVRTDDGRIETSVEAPDCIEIVMA